MPIDELLNNIISYAFRDESEHRITIDMELSGERLTVVIADDGVPFDPLSVETPDTETSLQDRKIGGLGVALVRSVVDSVTYQRQIGKNVMTLTKLLE